MPGEWASRLLVGTVRVKGQGDSVNRLVIVAGLLRFRVKGHGGLVSKQVAWDNSGSCVAHGGCKYTYQVPQPSIFCCPPLANRISAFAVDKAVPVLKPSGCSSLQL